jgi:hypothetical protein
LLSINTAPVIISVFLIELIKIVVQTLYISVSSSKPKVNLRTINQRSNGASKKTRKKFTKLATGPVKKISKKHTGTHLSYRKRNKDL